VSSEEKVFDRKWVESLRTAPLPLLEAMLSKTTPEHLQVAQQYRSTAEAEFRRRKRGGEARERFAAVWAAFQLASPSQGRVLMSEMDSLQPLIADGPGDPRWAAFTASLPGYREFWAQGAGAIIGELFRPGEEPTPS
jgi:hypothetical protein